VLADYTLDMNGQELYPSSNILALKKSNAEGKEEFGDISLKVFWFSRDPRDELRTETRNS
jgi:hypothetical protein